MPIEVITEPAPALGEYGDIPISFEVREVFDVVEGEAGTLRLEVRALSVPYIKDYDALGEHPRGWPERFDLTNWGFFSALIGRRCVGRAAVAYDTGALEWLGHGADLALLWDIRVAPDARRRGVGSALFDAAIAGARARGCAELAIETQNTNVAACRFYEKAGCALGVARREAYAELPDEVQLLWFKDLLPRSPT
jgi:ribosomal protein S18 acetylase RimI-like enzyme